jgi:biotin operon repressor
MDQENPLDLDLEIDGLLTALGIDWLCQWDVLVFLYRHPTSLLSGEHIARLLGYATTPVVAALDHLEPLGLVRRSRVDQGVRLYQFSTPVEPPRGDALKRLLTLSDSRSIRLLLVKRLQRVERADPNNGPSRKRNDKGSAVWLKAI